MEIKQTDNGEEGMFYIETDGNISAQMTYTLVGSDRIVINHTDVSETHKGKGVGKQLVTKAVEFARKKGIKIVPLCSFTQKVLSTTPEFKDVL